MKGKEVWGTFYKSSKCMWNSLSVNTVAKRVCIVRALWLGEQAEGRIQDSWNL